MNVSIGHFGTKMSKNKLSRLTFLALWFQIKIKRFVLPVWYLAFVVKHFASFYFERFDINIVLVVKTEKISSFIGHVCYLFKLGFLKSFILKLCAHTGWAWCSAWILKHFPLYWGGTLDTGNHFFYSSAFVSLAVLLAYVYVLYFIHSFPVYWSWLGPTWNLTF